MKLSIVDSGSVGAVPGAGVAGPGHDVARIDEIDKGGDAGAALRRVHRPRRPPETAENVDERRQRAMARELVEAAGDSLDDETIAVLRVTFKPNTEAMRAGPSLVVVRSLLFEGAGIRAVDSEGTDDARELLDGVACFDDAAAASSAADTTVLTTEWNQSPSLDFTPVRALMRRDIFVDPHNVYDFDSMTAASLAYVGLGEGTRPQDMPLDIAASA